MWGWTLLKSHVVSSTLEIRKLRRTRKICYVELNLHSNGELTSNTCMGLCCLFVIFLTFKSFSFFFLLYLCYEMIREIHNLWDLGQQLKEPKNYRLDRRRVGRDPGTPRGGVRRAALVEHPSSWAKLSPQSSPNLWPVVDQLCFQLSPSIPSFSFLSYLKI